MKGQCCSDVVVDIEQLQNNLIDHQDIHSANEVIQHDNNQSFLCELQQHIFDIHTTDFDPFVVSIGPYHYGKQSLRAMEKNKWKCLDYILKENPDKILDDYIEVRWEMYPLMRNYCIEKFKPESSKFVEMFLLDACFVLVFLCGYNVHSVPEESSSEELDPLAYLYVAHDLLLANNQIPFVIVKKIYEVFVGNEDVVSSLSDAYTIYIEKILCNYPKPIKERERRRDFGHLLHLCHLYLKPSEYDSSCNSELSTINGSPPCHWYRAIEYHIAGIKFEKREFIVDNPHSLLDVTFKEDVLQIPYLTIDENTTTIFRNLIALEQISPQFGNDVTAYVIFLSHLIATAEDVDLLSGKGIIAYHFESREEVLIMCRQLSELVLDFDFSGNYYLKNICWNMEKHYKEYMKWWKGWLKRTTFTVRSWV